MVRLLTRREFEIFKLLGSGLKPRAIAKQLNRSLKTIEAHRENIKNRLNLPDSDALFNAARAYVQRTTLSAPTNIPSEPIPKSASSSPAAPESSATL